MKALLSLLAFLALTCAAAAAEETFTPQELKFLHDLRGVVEKQCQDGVQQARQIAKKGLEGEPPGVAQSIDTLAFSGGYCDCVGETFEKTTTPTDMHGGRQAGEAVMKRVARQCVVASFRTNFPAFCREAATGAAFGRPGAGLDEKTTGTACACAQEDVDALTADTFDAYMEATRRDYQEYRRNPAKPVPGNSASLLGTFTRCGLARAASRGNQ